jgi:hypothetical protein
MLERVKRLRFFSLLVDPRGAEGFRELGGMQGRETCAREKGGKKGNKWHFRLCMRMKSYQYKEEKFLLSATKLARISYC